MNAYRHGDSEIVSRGGGGVTTCFTQPVASFTTLRATDFLSNIVSEQRA